MAIAAQAHEGEPSANRLCLAGALLFALLFDYDLVWVSYIEARSIHPPFAARALCVLEIALVVGAVFVLLRTASTRPWLFVLVVLSIFATCEPVSFFTGKFQIGVRTAVMSFLDSSEKERSFVGWGSIRSFAAALLAAGALCAGRLHARSSLSTERSRWPVGFIAALAAGALALDAAYFDGRARAKAWLDYLPLGVGSQSWHYFRDTRAYANKVDISRYASALREANDDLLFVFVIGESVRAGNFSLNGYARPTNPELSRLSNLVSFTRVSSAATTTRKSVPVLLTRYTRERTLPLRVAGWTYNDVYVNETSFISVFHKLAFSTAFLANWRQYGIWDTAESLIADEADYTYHSSSLDRLGRAERDAYLRRLGVKDAARFAQANDENLLVVLEHRLSAITERRALFVLHPYGSHYPYSWYPKEFEVFTPVCDFSAVGFDLERCGKERLVNSYDNTILYADWLLAEIIRRLGDRNAVLFFVGDHAESLGENGLYMHSHEVEIERHVPLLVWASGRYLADPVNRLRFATLRANADRAVTHDFVFHTTLDLAGIEAPGLFDPRLSLCRPFADEVAVGEHSSDQPPNAAQR